MLWNQALAISKGGSEGPKRGDVEKHRATAATPSPCSADPLLFATICTRRGGRRLDAYCTKDYLLRKGAGHGLFCAFNCKVRLLKVAQGIETFAKWALRR